MTAAEVVPVQPQQEARRREKALMTWGAAKHEYPELGLTWELIRGKLAARGLAEYVDDNTVILAYWGTCAKHGEKPLLTRDDIQSITAEPTDRQQKIAEVAGLVGVAPMAFQQAAAVAAFDESLDYRDGICQTPFAEIQDALRRLGLEVKTHAGYFRARESAQFWCCLHSGQFDRRRAALYHALNRFTFGGKMVFDLSFVPDDDPHRFDNELPF